MLFFYVRHGDPIYDPDSLTPLGKRQADALAKRLALYGIDEVFSSTSVRAIQTATPTCELTRNELTTLDFCHEKYAFSELSRELNGKRRWIFEHPETLKLLTDPSVISLGYDWYTHPDLAQYKNGVYRIYDNADEFFLTLGYEHIRGTGRYKVISSNDRRVALFAHQGFGLTLLSGVLDIPFPLFTTHFDICHSSMTVVEFKEVDGYAIPRVLTLSSDSHLYRDGLPTKYNRRIYF